MNQRLKEHIHPNKFIYILALLSAIFGIGILFISDFFIIPFVAFFASLLLFAPGKKIICAILSAVILICSFLGGVAGVFAISSALVCSLLLWGMYYLRCSKADAVLAITAFFSLFLLVALFLSICNITKVYSIPSAMMYYENLLEQQKIAFIETFSNLHVMDENGISVYLFTEETAEAMFLSIASLTIAFLVISAFCLCGFTCKIFSSILMYAERDERVIRAWRFQLPNITVYFYIVLFLFSFFSSGEALFDIVILNLLYIFMAVFSYIGLRHLFFIVSKIRRRGLAFFVIVFLFLFLSVSALQILSFLGVYVSIISNRVQKE